MLKFIRGKGQQPTAERQKLQKDLFAFRKVSKGWGKEREKDRETFALGEKVLAHTRHETCRECDAYRDETPTEQGGAVLPGQFDENLFDRSGKIFNGSCLFAVSIFLFLNLNGTLIEVPTFQRVNPYPFTKKYTRPYEKTSSENSRRFANTFSPFERANYSNLLRFSAITYK